MLEVRDLRFAYGGGIAAVQGISFRVTAGETVSLVGPNGAGKTTTARLVSGVLGPYHGDVAWQGESLCGASPRAITARGIVQVPEGRHLFPGLDVETNLLLGGTRRRQVVRALQEDLAHIYELFPVLRERRHQAAGTLSGGEQQMAAVGRALMARPHLLILDEPTMGLAPKVVADIFAVVVRLRQSQPDLAILLIEQNAALALEVSDRGYVMEAGVMRAEGAAGELLRRADLRTLYIG
jgi:branched-chain amino acid transport system ATP-binding protein